MTHRIITAEEARALREAATPGPWHVGRSALCDCLRPCVNVYADQGEDVTRPCRSEVCEEDAPLLAAAPDLAATVEALHAEVERLRALVATAYVDGFNESNRDYDRHPEDIAHRFWLASDARAALESTP